MSLEARALLAILRLSATQPDGSRYEGFFSADAFHGRGTYTFPDGSTYEGDWVQNKRHGHGKQTHADGAVQEGSWEDNVYVEP